MKRSRNAGGKRCPSPAKKRNKKLSIAKTFLLSTTIAMALTQPTGNSVAAASLNSAPSTQPPKPSYLDVGTFKVGERSFPNRQRVPAGMKTDVFVWAVRVKAQKSRSAVTRYIVFTPTDVEVTTHTHSITH